MNASEKIEHEGIVESVGTSRVNVRIVNESACSACHANGTCSAADLQDKLIEISTNDSELYSVGQKVVITGQSKQGFKAALFAYVIPTVLMISSMLITFTITNNDILSGILALGILIPYFTIISLLRKKLQKTFSFSLKPF